MEKFHPSPLLLRRQVKTMRMSMVTRGILLLVACVCDSAQGRFPALKNVALGSDKAGVAEAWDQMSEQVKANAEAVKAAMPGRK